MENTITYRYMWKLKDNDSIRFRVITGIEAEHEEFKNNLLDEENIELAMREYICTYDSDFVGQIDKIKTFNKENENDEKNSSN